MFSVKKFSVLIQANFWSIGVPILTLFILSRYTSNTDFADFIGSYATILLMSTVIDFGSRSLFMFSDDLELQASADGLKLLLALLFTIVYVLYTLYLGQDLVVILLFGLLWKDVLIPMYKFKHDMYVYNLAGLISSFILIGGILLVIWFKDIFYIYLSMFLSVLPAWKIRRIGHAELSCTGVINFVKVSGNFAASNFVVGLGQNGLKMMLLETANPRILVEFEIISKLANIGRYLINVIVEYIQLYKSLLSKARLIGISVFVQLIGTLCIFFITDFAESYFKIQGIDLVYYSFIYFPLVLLGYYHKVILVKNGQTFLVFFSVGISTLGLILYVFCIDIIHTRVLVISSILFEYTVLLFTFVGIKILNQND